MIFFSLYIYFSVLRGIKCIIINKLLEFLFYFKLYLYFVNEKKWKKTKTKTKVLSINGKLKYIKKKRIEI